MLVNMLHITVFEVPAATEPPTTTDQPTTEQSTTEPTQPIVQQDLHWHYGADLKLDCWLR